MRTRISTVLVTFGLCLAVAAPAWAQAAADQAKPPQAPGTQKPAPQTTKPKPKPTPKLPIGFRFFGAFESTMMKAKETFKATTGSSRVNGFAAGADIMNLWRKVFLRFDVANGSTEGTRGFVDDRRVFISNGIPVTIGVRNVELGAGWRTYLGRQQHMALYFGAGVTKASNSQESPNAEPGDNDSVGGRGSMAFFGLDYTLQKRAKNPIFIGVEGVYRSIGDVLGTSGVSDAFGESNLGGFAARVTFGLRLRK